MKKTLGALGGVALYVLLAGFLFYRTAVFPPDPKEESSKDPPGWETLSSCADLTSFDGLKSLALDDENKATLSVPDAVDQDGHWALVDAARKTYRLAFGDDTTTYTVVKPTGTDGCILSPGTDLQHADLSASWFATSDPDDE